MPTALDTKTALRYCRPGTADRTELIRCVQATFPAPHGEVMARTLGIGELEYLGYTRLVCDKALLDGISIVALEPDGRIAGFCLNEDFATAPRYSEKPIDAKFRPLIALLEALDDGYARTRKPRPGHTFHLYMLGVRPELARRGVARALAEESLMLARERGYRTAVAEATGSGSQALVAQLGFETVGQIGYGDFRFEGEPVFGTIAQPQACRLVEKRLLTRAGAGTIRDTAANRESGD